MRALVLNEFNMIYGFRQTCIYPHISMWRRQLHMLYISYFVVEFFILFFFVLYTHTIAHIYWNGGVYVYISLRALTLFISFSTIEFFDLDITKCNRMRTTCDNWVCILVSSSLPPHFNSTLYHLSSKGGCASPMLFTHEFLLENKIKWNENVIQRNSIAVPMINDPMKNLIKSHLSFCLAFT